MTPSRPLALVAEADDDGDHDGDDDEDGDAAEATVNPKTLLPDTAGPAHRLLTTDYRLPTTDF